MGGRRRGKGGPGSHHRQNGRNLRNHHIWPSSRGGADLDNLVALPGHVHDCWHKVFGNLTPEEAKTFIDLVMQPGGRWTFKGLEELRRTIIARKG